MRDLTERQSGPDASQRGSGAGGGGRVATAWPIWRMWLVLAMAMLAGGLWSSGLGRRGVVNPGGWTLMGRFWAAMVDPELSARYVGVTWRATLVTVAFAVIGTAVAVVAGLILGILTSETWWHRARSRPGQAPTRAGWFIGRGMLGLPRGTHEVVWGLFLVNVLGRDPMVGVLAIGIPFSAVTAKVYAELIDEADPAAFDALRRAGVGRVAALAYGVLPATLPDMVSYAFYRLECSLRAAVILGMIGAGGLGFELGQSFLSLRYREMWTLIYALVALSALADWWGARLRQKGTKARTAASLFAGGLLVMVSSAALHPSLGRLFTGHTQSLLRSTLTAVWPPSLPADGWTGLARSSLDTIEMSLLAIVMASAVAVFAGFLAARGGATPARRAAGAGTRLVLLVTRAIPPPVWALLVLFVMFPGPLPGAVALAIYNFGILGRLMAEVAENVDQRPSAALRACGAGDFSAFAYATLPLSGTRFVAYSLYRWEVAARETIVVGVVGAGGLGRLLEEQRVAFDLRAMFGTVLALIAVSIAVDLVSASARRSLRRSSTADAG